jgi:hypothetical protein
MVVALIAGTVTAIPPRTPQQEQAYRLLREKKFAESVEVFAPLVRDNPYAGDLFAAYGQALHGAGRDDEAIRAMQTAAELGWSPSANFYNIACVLALRGDRDKAIDWLSKSLDAGFAEQETLTTDTDMDPLRSDPRFIELTGLKPPSGRSRDEQWRYDLDFFARRMRQMHWNLYMKTTREKFLGDVEQLKADVPKLEDRQVLARLTRIVASVGDGHTRLRLTPDDAPPPPRLPVRFYQFDDGLFITAVHPKHADESLLGARVLRVGPLAVESALEAAKPYCSVDNPMGYLSGAPRVLELTCFLEAIGAAPDDREASLTVRKVDGSETTVTLQPSSSRPTTFRLPSSAPTSSRPTRALYRRIEKRNCAESSCRIASWCTSASTACSISPIPVSRSSSRSCSNSSSRTMPNDWSSTCAPTAAATRDLVMPLIHGLVRCDRVNRDGHLFVIIGRDTFSAAVNTVSLLEQHTQATFVGEPPGSPPSFVGEGTYFTLPYHGNRVTCSSRYWQWGPSVDKRVWVAPRSP